MLLVSTSFSYGCDEIRPEGDEDQSSSGGFYELEIDLDSDDPINAKERSVLQAVGALKSTLSDKQNGDAFRSSCSTNNYFEVNNPETRVETDLYQLGSNESSLTLCINSHDAVTLAFTLYRYRWWSPWDVWIKPHHEGWTHQVGGLAPTWHNLSGGSKYYVKIQTRYDDSIIDGHYGFSSN